MSVNKVTALLSVAIDGPVSAGKSTLCDALAKRLDILHLDTGAMYRAVGLYVVTNGIPADNENAVKQILEEGLIKIRVRYQDRQQITLLNDKDVTAELRTEAVGAAASAVSRFPAVRRYLVNLQQQLAKEQSLLIDGRDIGTVVLPEASVKIYLNASPETRALRRYTQLISSGVNVDYPTVLRDLIARDVQDQDRVCDPLRPAEDAVILDTTHLNFEESLQKMLSIVRGRHG
jgi:cytidylate kinase